MRVPIAKVTEMVQGLKDDFSTILTQTIEKAVKEFEDGIAKPSEDPVSAVQLLQSMEKLSAADLEKIQSFWKPDIESIERLRGMSRVEYFSCFMHVLNLIRSCKQP